MGGNKQDEYQRQVADGPRRAQIGCVNGLACVIGSMLFSLHEHTRLFRVDLHSSLIAFTLLDFVLVRVFFGVLVAPLRY